VEIGDTNNPMNPKGENMAKELEILIKEIEKEINQEHFQGYIRFACSLGEETIYSGEDPMFAHPTKKVQRFMLFYS